MHTQCPSCHTLFRVAPAQLEAAHGKVRCGSCRAVFDARAHVTDAPPEDSAPVSPPSDVNAHRFTPPETGEAETLPAAPSAQVSASQAVSDQLHPAAAAINPLDEPPSPSSRRRFPWAVLNVLALIVLFGQVAVLYREPLSRTAALGPAVEAVCVVMGCNVSPWRDLSAIELTTRSVQSHPRYQGALLVDVAFVNRAAFAQPYPDLRLTFLNTEERSVASRRFRPENYLGSVPTGPLPAGAEAHGVLEILDPGENAFGFEFEFL